MAHPGDGEIDCIALPRLWIADYSHAVQRVFAIGKPPEGKLCLFAHMKNVVVLPSVGK